MDGRRAQLAGSARTVGDNVGDMFGWSVGPKLVGFGAIADVVGSLDVMIDGASVSAAVLEATAMLDAVVVIVVLAQANWEYKRPPSAFRAAREYRATSMT